MNLKQIVVFVSTGFFVGIVWGVAVNNASFIDENWEDMWVFAGGEGAKLGWFIDGGERVSFGEKEVTISMLEASGGGAKVSTCRLDAFSESGLFSEKYIVTMRAKVVQFPDVDVSSQMKSAKGIVLVDIRREKRVVVVLTASSIWVNGKEWTEIPVKTEVGIYYTWQFEVDDAAGIVSVFRGENGENGELTGLASDVPISLQNVPDQIFIGNMTYNDANTKQQGSLVIDSFLVGKEGI